MDEKKETEEFWEERMFSYVHSTLIWKFDKNSRHIVLTYDSGFEDNETSQLLDVLKEHDIKATFFLTGVWVETFPELARRIAGEGHEIGNHSYDHPDMVMLPAVDIVSSILLAEEVIRNVTGRNPRPLFREPFGSWNKEVFKAVGAAGYKYSIYWNIDTIDWQLPPTRVIVNRILRKVKGGDIVLMHLAGNHTAEATDITIRNLKAYGFKFATIGEMLKYN